MRGRGGWVGAPSEVTRISGNPLLGKGVKQDLSSSSVARKQGVNSLGKGSASCSAHHHEISAKKDDANGDEKFMKGTNSGKKGK